MPRWRNIPPLEKQIRISNLKFWPVRFDATLQKYTSPRNWYNHTQIWIKILDSKHDSYSSMN
jgi:hypothetical protein